jgi:hypothetical protein
MYILNLSCQHIVKASPIITVHYRNSICIITAVQTTLTYVIEIMYSRGYRKMRGWSVPSSEVTKCDTNISPRRLITHLLHQMVHYRTNRRGSRHWSATIKRDNIRTINQTKVPMISKITSESCAMVSFLRRPWTTGKVGCRTATYSTSSGTKFGSSSVKTRQEWVHTYSTSPTTPAEGNNKDHARIYQGWG